MAIDDKVASRPATNEDVAIIAIKTTIALSAVAVALEKLTKSGDITKQVEVIRKKANEIEEIFDELTGWTDDDG